MRIWIIPLLLIFLILFNTSCTIEKNTNYRQEQVIGISQEEPEYINETSYNRARYYIEARVK